MVQSRLTTCLFVALSLVICNGCNEFEQRHFKTLAAAKVEHMIEKSWIPTFIASDAKDISFSGDLDAATVIGSYTSGDTALLRKHCSSAEDSLSVPVDGPKWFSDDVIEAGRAGKLKRKGYEVFRCDEGNFAAVVLSSRQYVYYWTLRRSR